MKTRRWRPARRWLLAAVLTAGVVAAGFFCTPLPEELTAPLPPSVEFVDREGRPLRRLLVDERRFSQPIGLRDVSPAVIETTISAEDARFWHHPGVDPFAILRALADRARGVRTPSGASTITQQVIKLAMPGPRTWTRKLWEAGLALKLELHWSKERIFAEYLNRLEYGNLCTGLGEASRFYFGKPPGDLSVQEAAFLAGLPRAPSRLNPHAEFSAALSRQRWVLSRMRANGFLDEVEFRRTIATDVQLEPLGREFAAPHFIDLVLRRQGLTVPTGGTVRTTLDLKLNRFAEASLARNLEEIAERNASGGAVVVIHNPTGDVMALAGSGDYFNAESGQVNGAWAVRSPGSAVKPFTYLLALERGAEPSSIVADVPTAFATETGRYGPNNYNHRFHGPVSLRFALGNSLNVAAIRTLQMGGGPEALHAMLRQGGVTTLGHPASYYGLGLTLGNGEVRLLELTGAYSMLARLGVHRPWRLIEGGPHSEGRRIASEAATWQVADMLSDNQARMSSFGARSFLRFDFPVACKTGTSSDYRDNWAFGYTPEFTLGVWIGNPNGAPMRGITGVTGAAPVMHEVMCHLEEKFGVSWFERPREIERHPVEPLTGRLVSADRHGAVWDWCRLPPEPAQNSDYDAEGRVRLGSEYRDWLASGQNSIGDLAVLADAAPRLRILEPEPGAVFYLDADLSPKSQWIPLRAEGVGSVDWESGSDLQIEAGRLWLAEGRHVVTAVERESGARVATWIEVRRW